VYTCHNWVGKSSPSDVVTVTVTVTVFTRPLLFAQACQGQSEKTPNGPFSTIRLPAV
jgi:hypothetical protein